MPVIGVIRQARLEPDVSSRREIAFFACRAGDSAADSFLRAATMLERRHAVSPQASEESASDATEARWAHHFPPSLFQPGIFVPRAEPVQTCGHASLPSPQARASLGGTRLRAKRKPGPKEDRGHLPELDGILAGALSAFLSLAPLGSKVSCAPGAAKVPERPVHCPTLRARERITVRHEVVSIQQV